VASLRTCLRSCSDSVHRRENRDFRADLTQQVGRIGTQIGRRLVPRSRSKHVLTGQPTPVRRPHQRRWTSSPTARGGRVCGAAAGSCAVGGPGRAWPAIRPDPSGLPAGAGRWDRRLPLEGLSRGHGRASHQSGAHRGFAPDLIPDPVDDRH
jgi:hypothetical protein